jgi:uncharacterized protein YgiM (DUF1202 family)
MLRLTRWAVAALAMGVLAGCESLPEGALGDIGRSVFGDVANTAATTASMEAIRSTADRMCSDDNTMCRNLTMTAMSGFTASFLERLAESDVREINEARNISIETGEPQVWENPQTGASGRVESTPAPPRAPEPTPVKVKKDRLQSLPMMDAVGAPYVVVSRSGINVRGGPDTDYSVVDRLQGNERIQAIGKVRDADWFLVGRGSVGIGYVFADLIEPWSPPSEQPLDASLPSDVEDDADVDEVAVAMGAECFTTTQQVRLADGTTEEATVTSCRTPNGWAQV